MNNNYDYEVFIKELNKHIEDNNSVDNYKVVKALNDTKKSFDSLDKLNLKEKDMFFKILFASLSVSIVKRK